MREKVERKNRSFKASEAEWERLRRVAKKRGTTVSGLIRRLGKDLDRQDDLEGR